MGVFSNIRAHAPSRRVGAIAILLCALIVVVVISQTTTPTTIKNILVARDDMREYENELDTDGDGLKDWEEVLWGFSAVNPDTDGDGIGDREEAENERRLVAETPAQILAHYETTSSLEQPDSKALAGQILLSQLFASKQAGLPIPQQSVELAGEIALRDVPTERTYATYTQADIVTTATTNTAALRAYGNAVGQALKNPNGEAQHELLVILAYVQSNDLTTFTQDMDTVLQNYNRVVAGLLAVSTPTTFAPLHVNLINAIARVQQDLTDIRNIETSPIVATIALDAYEKNSTTMAQLFEYVREALQREGITYATSEPGYALMQTSY